MARDEPELAARVLVSALPAAAASVPGRLEYRLVLDGMGAYHVALDGGKAEVTEEHPAAPNGEVDFTLETDPETFALLARGAHPLRLMLGGRLRVHGKRRRALKLRHMEADLTMRDIVRAGVRPDPDLLYRALPYAIDPAWTWGHRFSMQYVVEGDDTNPGGEWFLVVDDGSIETAAAPPDGAPDSIVRMSHDTWLALVGGDLIPNEAMRRGLVQVDGRMLPVTLMGRWIERSEGRDHAELEREVRQAAVQNRRATWGSGAADAGAGGQGDPAVDHARRKGGQLMSYEDLYALWERQNWKAHEIDFTADKEQWLATPSISQLDTRWSFSSFYIGEERVAADLAPFVAAAPSGEIEIFLATQLVDEARHAAFFDRFMAEVMALDAEDIRGRLAAMEETMLPAWRTVFDDQLREIAKQIQARPDDLDLFVEGIVTYHVVIEGVLAMTGQHQILRYLTDHEIFPGFRQGFSLVEQDEHRHIAFGVRFLAEVCEREPRYRDLIERKIAELVPVATHVFVPPGTEDPSDFVSFDYHSSEIYGFAYRALKRRMAVVGVDVPPPEELMPGPIDRVPAPA
ncbi:MAG: SCP2 sterol-binding domain-containing protein [Solirubrobacterales bacterium]